MSYFNFQPQFTGVVRHLVIINVLMFLGTRAIFSTEDGWIQLAAFLPGSGYFQPYQIATHMFMHANLPHIAFNMLTLYFFGPMVEMVWGPRRFLFYYISCGLGALALHMGIEYWQLSEAGQSVIDYQGCMLGASGAIFGVLVAFAYLFPEQRLRMLFPPIEMKAKYYVPLIAGLELFYGVQGFASGVAHFAHLGGAVAGFLLIFYWGGFRWR